MDFRVLGFYGFMGLGFFPVQEFCLQEDASQPALPAVSASALVDSVDLVPVASPPAMPCCSLGLLCRSGSCSFSACHACCSLGRRGRSGSCKLFARHASPRIGQLCQSGCFQFSACHARFRLGQFCERGVYEVRIHVLAWDHLPGVLFWIFIHRLCRWVPLKEGFVQISISIYMDLH
jgi:hypothetical protein